jgi:prepilin-type N-terminal cleavage/methylation domain-containing protein/prepilin-type processing-associated H-X9-DG protein
MFRRAFTLIELLVVIAIIGVLIGILLPALGAARRQAIALRCVSNVRQLELAHVGYMNDRREFFIDAGLGHGGPSAPAGCWPIALADYYGSARPVIRSPGDRSPYWPVSEGGQSTGLTFDRVIEMLAAGQSPTTQQIARWTSYGLNSFTTRFAQPSVQHPTSGQWLGPWDRLNRIPWPEATVHFLQMTEGLDGDAGGFARSDHVHPEDWGLLGTANAPVAAAAQVETAAHGGKARSWGAAANYGFLDGHAATLKFSDVYTEPFRNRFFPDFAR